MDVLAERILLDLKNTFKKDPLIDEFDILPIEESLSNKCPVLHVDHKVALEKWCVKPVYVYAYTKFFAWRRGQVKSVEISDHDCLLSWTSAILLINPDLETAWNTRKELILQGALRPKDELKLSELVLSRKPKCSPVYAHRRWVIRNCDIDLSLEHELFLCSRWADRYPSNYYAWNHRLWLIEHLYHNNPQAVQEELARSESWVTVHISDHCGLHYRQQLIAALQSVMQQNALQKEFQLCTELQRTYPGHEALWAHRRFLLWATVNHHQQYEFEKQRLEVQCAKDSTDGNSVPCPTTTQNKGKNNEVENPLNSPHSFENGATHETLNGKSTLDCNGVSLALDTDPVPEPVIYESGDVRQNTHFKIVSNNRVALDCGGVLSNAGKLLSGCKSQHCHEIFNQEAMFVCERRKAACQWPWESLLLQRHLKWVADVLGWTQLLERGCIQEKMHL